MSNTIIKEVTAEDAPELLEIYRYYVEHTAVSFEYETPTVEEFAERIRRITQKYPYLAAVRDGKTVGYAYAHAFVGREAYRFSAELTIYLDKSERRNGIGRLLYTELEKRLKEMGITNLYACIGVPADGKADEYITFDSQHFHEHMGFEIVGMFKKCGFKFGRWYSMIWAEKIIS